MANADFDKPSRTGGARRNEVLERMWRRVENTRSESDTAVFYDLLILGELVVKLIVIEMLAALDDDRDRHRYRLEHRLVRSNSVGDWVGALEDILTGPASATLNAAAYPEKREIIQNHGPASDSWQRSAVIELTQVCRSFDAVRPEPAAKVALRVWLNDFAWLRNRTRGHGAARPGTCTKVGPHLESSIRSITDNFAGFTRGWAQLRRTLIGKYHVAPIGGETAAFNYLKSSRDVDLKDGVYIELEGALRHATLIETDTDLRDFFIANGGFKDGSAKTPEYEVLSYITDDRKFRGATGYLTPTEPLPRSSTEGQPALENQGNTFANLPPKLSDYVQRPALEQELRELLVDDRHPIVTLMGRGGIGKTSTALEVLHQLAREGTFFAIVWFSARDIDLLVEGPKLVTPGVLTKEEIALAYVDLMDPKARQRDQFKPLDHFAEALGGNVWDKRVLFVFDNFETVRNPTELYQFLDTFVRLPNKILLTSRFRDFKADFPVEVKGMTRPEFDELIDTVAKRDGTFHLLTDTYRNELFDESDGHPYVVKVLLGEVARSGHARSVERVMASSELMLDALFERTYSSIAPAAQRAFLTLCNWRSMVPRLALEAALLRPRNERMDVARALETLQQCSLLDVITSSDGEGEYLRVPLAAYVFGQRKLKVSALKPAIDADTELLRSFGAAKLNDSAQGLEPRVDRMIRALAEHVVKGSDIEEEISVLEYIAQRHPWVWLQLARLYLEDPRTGSTRAVSALTAYLERVPDDRKVWLQLAELHSVADNGPEEINARLRIAQLHDSEYRDISQAANALNRYHASGRSGLDSDSRRSMLRDLSELMESRIDEADPTDLSRLAWLHLGLGEESEARRCVLRGLDLDPSNDHCRRLAGKLGLVAGSAAAE